MKESSEKKKEAEGKIKLLGSKVKELQEEFSDTQSQVEMLMKRIEDQSNVGGNEEELLKMKRQIDEL